MDERFTNFYLDYDLQDVTASRDASFPTPANQQSFTHIQDVVDKDSIELSFPRFTFEHNFNVLDGSLRPLEVEGSVPITVPYFNKTLSDANGDYDSVPTLTLTFSRTHSSFGFMFYFIEDYPLEMELMFWDKFGEPITRFTCKVDKLAYTTFHDVYGYARMQVRFTKTLPKRYVKLKYIKFGVVLTWDETNVQNGTIVQQSDRMSKQLAIDTLSFTVVDVAGKLNLGNTAGMHRYFQRDQIMYPYETIQILQNDGTYTEQRINLGKYYLNTFSEQTNLGKMTCQSYLGLMDSIMFYGGEIYNGKKAGLIIEAIFTTMGLEPEEYSIDSETYNHPLYGTITPKKCREALKEVLFATHSVINSHNLERIEIKKSTAIQKPDIYKGRKFSTKTKKNDYCYQVDVKYTTYTKESATKEISKGVYDAGTHTVYFTAPCTELTINRGTINSQSTYSCTFTVPSAGEVILTGYAYSTATSIASNMQENLEAGQVASVQTFTTNLLNAKQALELAQKLLKYLNYDLTITVKALADDNDMEDFHIVENPVDRFSNYYGMYTKRSIDLTGGFISTDTLIGTTIEEPITPFAREDRFELYAGGETII
jgi:hypothetical protein